MNVWVFAFYPGIVDVICSKSSSVQLRVCVYLLYSTVYALYAFADTWLQKNSQIVIGKREGNYFLTNDFMSE